MPENVTYHGSAFGDVAEEWHKLPTWGKFAVGGLFIAVAGIGYYEFSKSKSSGVTPQGSSAGSAADLAGAGANQFPTVPGGNTGTVPVLPGGVCPVFDSSGNLVAFGPCTAPTSTSKPPPVVKKHPKSNPPPVHKHHHVNNLPSTRVASSSHAPTSHASKPKPKPKILSPIAGLTQEQAIGFAGGTHPQTGRTGTGENYY